MQTNNKGVVIVGAGLAGATCAQTLRQQGYAGSVTLLGDESVPPYNRPPLSKAYLKGEIELDRLMLKADEFYTQHQITLHMDCHVTEIDTQRQVVVSSAGDIPYSSLVIATGCLPRSLPVPGAELGNVMHLRTVADADRLKSLYHAGAGHVAIAGGGFIGLEVAASLRHSGVAVTVIERESRLLARVASPELSKFFGDYHRLNGVELLLDSAITELRGLPGGNVQEVVLADGRVLPVNAVVVGIGAVPNSSIAQAAGILCDGGIIVDEDCHTSVPDIFAIGDVTRRPMEFYEKSMMRLESVPSALEQARRVAFGLVGKPLPAAGVPWFWSDQYDVKLQIGGLAHWGDRTITRQFEAPNQFAVFHLRADRLVAVEAVNAPQAFVAGQRMIAAGTPIDAARLADPAVSMKDLISTTVA
ncbi:NAD(P)/FAD-dependent oxidoreductase [Pseudomonas sp. NFX224]|uniref:NAD(P)/FAD-dependent oxidoreductase n=1 Tax=Pseudomonas sp. NFX224 TaxID=3402862 RepID=UPI003AFA98E1